MCKSMFVCTVICVSVSIHASLDHAHLLWLYIMFMLTLENCEAATVEQASNVTTMLISSCILAESVIKMKINKVYQVDAYTASLRSLLRSEVAFVLMYCLHIYFQYWATVFQWFLDCRIRESSERMSPFSWGQKKGEWCWSAEFFYWQCWQDRVLSHSH